MTLPMPNLGPDWGEIICKVGAAVPTGDAVGEGVAVTEEPGVEVEVGAGEGDADGDDDEGDGEGKAV